MRADIHNGQEHKCSIHGPDTEAQDQPPPSLTFGLQHTAGPYKRVTTVMPYMRVFGQRPHQPSLTSGLLWPVTDRSPMVSQIGRQSHKTLKPLQMLIPLLMQKLVVNQAIEAMGLKNTGVLATIFDGITRHSPDGLNFKQRAETVGWKQAVRERDSGTWDWTENRPINPR
jgi:hypothetical protein